MKKLLLGIALCASVGANAQLPNGSVAPDFTITDIDGVTHTLSTYMAAGKTVIMDLSTTWCGPCWGFHQAHVLEQIHQAYGPNASDEVVVIFIEGDDATTAADLNGTGTNTQGDWVTGSSYAIADNGASIANDYQIGGWPTLYSICPDGGGASTGTTYDFIYSAEFNTPTIVSKINECNTVTGVSDHADLHASQIALCSTDGAPEVSFTNYGGNSITGATVILKENGAQVATENFSGTVAQYAEGIVSFPSMTINMGSTYTAELTAINTNTPFAAAIADVSVVTATDSEFDVEVNFFTDNYPSETSWEIVNSAGTTVASGGPYTPGTDDAGGAGGPDAQTTMTSNETLPNVDDCYKVVFTDVYGDGQQYGTGENPNGGFGIQIKSAGAEVFNWDGGSGWATTERDAAVKTTFSAVSLTENDIDQVSVYPNPAVDVINIKFSSSSDALVSISDLQGRVVASQTGSKLVTISTNGLASGSYIVTISTDSGNHTESVVIK